MFKLFSTPPKTKSLLLKDQANFHQQLTGFKTPGYTADKLRKRGFPAWAVKSAGYSLVEMKEAGYSARALKMAGFSKDEINTLFK